MDLKGTHEKDLISLVGSEVVGHLPRLHLQPLSDRGSGGGGSGKRSTALLFSLLLFSACTLFYFCTVCAFSANCRTYKNNLQLMYLVY